MYRCVCNKNYKTIYGLRNHAKQCSTNLAAQNPIGKLTDLKTTTVVSNGGAPFTSNTPSKPIMSVSIANVPKANGTLELNNQMEDDNQTKTPTLQHLLSPIDAKPQFTSQA